MPGNFFKDIFIQPFQSLKNVVFAKLFLAQTFSLLGDALTWVGLALIAYNIDNWATARILSFALTLRVTAYIVFSPFAGVLADRIKRKHVLLTTQACRMIIVSIIPFVSVEWHLYILVFLLNVFSAFFTPTYRAIIPQIVSREQYRQANGLSMATFQLLSVFGPAIAGIIVAVLGLKLIFYLNGLLILIAILMILTIATTSLQNSTKLKEIHDKNTWNGMALLFSNRTLRFALSIEFVSAVGGAMILVNTVDLIKTAHQLDDQHYGWIMAIFGAGGAVAAFLLGSLDKSTTRTGSLVSGALIVGLSILFANFLPFNGLMFLWLFAGIGQTLADMPSETLIGENISPQDQGKVYGSHFAVSHLWWAIAYPIAGFLGNSYSRNAFLYGGVLTVAPVVVICLLQRFFGRNQ